tara:strand:- start:670 stop:1149 length:480 start_codon:yes stop_codon:yes gene_type:complete
MSHLILMLAMTCTPTTICEELRGFRRFPVDRMVTCEKVVEVAEIWNIDPALLVAVAYHESRMNKDAVSRAGAVGPLQILPKWFCGSQACDYAYVGGRAYTKWRNRVKRKRKKLIDFWTLAHYNGGNRPGSRSFRYAKTVLKTRDILKRRLDRACDVPGC